MIKNWLTPVTAALAVVAFGFAAWAGVSWYGATHDDAITYAQTRDDVLRVARVGITNFRTLDHTKPDEGLNRWLESSTGTLHDEIARDLEAGKQRIVDARTTSSSTLLDAAVTELDDRAGTARVIAVMQTAVTPEGGDAATKFERYQAELQRTDAGWKLSAIGPVAAGGA
ncbi:nuclear transport factor 2 family protein [Umezawaea beigongshangensis]|uniref:nuclear transport factor 2 family protein n=1 Tax=Umezawaea beigongshangensis TaxID=2780383 RepID=UPI0018F193D6|nr:nuclear transport factor 2 family protein [Umezawaea beigongshangensis]